MQWLIVYDSGTKPGAGYGLTYPSGGWNGPVLALGGVGGFMAGMLSSATQAGANSGPGVLLQVKIDDGQPATMLSGTNFSNYAIVNFSYEPLNYDPATNELMVSHTKNMAVADVITLSNAQNVLVGLPREDGTSMYLEVHPQEPSFQQLLIACGVSALKKERAIHAARVDRSGDRGMARVTANEKNPVPSGTSYAKDTFSSKSDTVTDQTAGLMWTKRDSGLAATWNDADQYCSKLQTGGYSDWRLPESSELNTLYDPANKTKICEEAKGVSECNSVGIRPEITINSFSIWSRTNGHDIAMPDWAPEGPVARTKKIFDFFNGTILDRTYNYGDKEVNGALCVRSTTDVKADVPAAPKIDPPSTATQSHSPGIHDFSVSRQEVNVGESVVVSFQVWPPPGESMVRADLWMADDLQGHPNGWRRIDGRSLSGSNSAQVEFQNRLKKPGNYWFGVHAITSANREAHEDQPIKVTVRPR